MLFADHPLWEQSERAFRDAVLAAAQEASEWDSPDFEAIDAAWEARREACERARVEVDGIFKFRLGHEIEAARTRGYHHGLVFVEQAWDHPLAHDRLPYELPAWYTRVARWAAEPLVPGKYSCPPRPDDDWPRPSQSKPSPSAKPVGNLEWLRNGTKPDGNPIPEGQRNDTLARLAGSMRRFGMSQTEIASALHQANRLRCVPPLPTAEVDRIAKSISRYAPDPIAAAAMQPWPPTAEPDEFPVQSLRELVMQYPHLREPLIHGLLRKGETLNVIASPKVGKSWLVSDLALAVSTGRPWLGIFPCEQGRVLLIDNELHKETSASRIPKVMEARGITLAECGDRIDIVNLRGELKDIFGLGACFSRIDSGKYKLVVIDAFYRAMPRDTDENDNGAMAQVYNVLDAYAAKLQCSFVLVHHSTKGNQSAKSVTDVGAGAGAQSRAADTHLILRPHEEPGVVVLDAAVRSWPPTQPRCLRWSFPVWTVEDALDPADLKSEKPRRKPKPAPQPEPCKPSKPEWTAASFVAEFVTETPAMTARIVHRATEADVPEPLAKKLLKQAEAAGLVHRWKFGANQPVQFATRPQPEDE